MEINDIKKMNGFFHDGTIDNIRQLNGDIYIWMESVEMLPEWLERKPIQVNNDFRIKGVLHCMNVKDIVINHAPQESIQMDHDLAEILDFKIESKTSISLLVIWHDWTSNPISSNTGLIKIEAQNFVWIHDDYRSASRDHKFESSYKPQETS